MYRTILAPVDGSPHAEHALPWAFALADVGATVYVAQAHNPTPPILIEGVVVADPGIDTSVREAEAGYLSGLADRLAAVPGASVAALALDSADALPDALAQAAADCGAELMVMTTHGRGPLARFLLGSITDDTVRVSPVPVLVVRGPEDAPADLAARPTIPAVLVPLDGSPHAEAILPAAARLAKGTGADLTLLMVADAQSDEALPVGTDDLPGALNPLGPVRQADMYLDRVARELGEKGVAARTKLVRHGDPATVILAHANERPGTAVAVTTRGRSGLSRLLHGSVAEAVVHGAAGPVLVYHPPG